MQLFSKRYPPYYFRRYQFDSGSKNLFINDPLRNRLKQVIKFVASSKDKFLEPFLRNIDKRDGSIHLNTDALQNLTSSEIGYDLTTIFNCYNLSFESEQYSDFYLFDLIEILLIFATESKRNDVIKRFQKVFDEENSEFVINNFMVVSKKRNWPSGNCSTN